MAKELPNRAELNALGCFLEIACPSYVRGVITRPMAPQAKSTMLGAWLQTRFRRSLCQMHPG